jgi:hypothetical protein
VSRLQAGGWEGSAISCMVGLGLCGCLVVAALVLVWVGVEKVWLMEGNAVFLFCMWQGW